MWSIGLGFLLLSYNAVHYWLGLSSSTTWLIMLHVDQCLRVRKILFYWNTKNLVSFCIEVGFLLSICCHIKLIKQLFVSILHLCSVSLIILHVKIAISVKHLKSKFFAVSLLECIWKALLNACRTHLCFIYHFHEIKELFFGSFQQSLSVI